jgi:hypothetical protein
MSNKRYIGDGVYVEYDVFMLKLTTEDGDRATNTIYLEPEVYEQLVAYVGDFRNEAEGPDGFFRTR